MFKKTADLEDEGTPNATNRGPEVGISVGEFPGEGVARTGGRFLLPEGCKEHIAFAAGISSFAETSYSVLLWPVVTLMAKSRLALQT